MAQLDAELIWEDGVHFIGTSPSGHTIHLDGNKTAGASPMELILLGLGGCASYDVVTIMKKISSRHHGCPLPNACPQSRYYPCSIYRYSLAFLW